MGAYKLPKPPVLAKVTKKDVFRKKKRTRGRKGGKPLQKKREEQTQGGTGKSQGNKKGCVQKKEEKNQREKGRQALAKKREEQTQGSTKKTGGEERVQEVQGVVLQVHEEKGCSQQ